MLFAKSFCFCCLSLIVIGSATPVGDAPVGNDPLEPLNRRVGSWINKVVEKKAAWNPVERTIAGEEKIQWVLDKNFIQGDMVMEDGAKGRWFIKYDADAKVYRSWFFGNNSFPGGDTIGRWNPKLERMDWEFKVGNDHHGKMRFQFSGQDKMEWKITIHDGRGQLMIESVGVQTRKK